MTTPARTVLVTGGAVRLGRAVVEAFAARGWSVAYTYNRSREAAEALEASLRHGGADAAALQFEADDRPARATLPDRVLERFGRLDALVNNAAVFPRTPIAGLDEETFRGTLVTNLEAPLFLSLACAPHLREARGSVVNIADIYGLYPLRDHLAYAVSKAGLLAATRGLALELAPEVRVNAVAPGIAMFPEDYPAETRDRLLARTLLGREGGGGDVAAAVTYLVVDTTTTTGQVLVVDGGRTVAL